MSLYELLVNGKKIKTNTWQKAAFKHFVTDFPTLFKMILKNIYKKPEKRLTKYAVWETSDLVPFFYELLYLPFNIFKR